MTLKLANLPDVPTLQITAYGFRRATPADNPLSLRLVPKRRTPCAILPATARSGDSR